MVAIVVFHVLTLLLGLGIASRAISEQRIADALGYLHNTIGISTPPLEKVRMIALIWVGTTVVIVDGCLLMLVVITRIVR